MLIMHQSTGHKLTHTQTHARRLAYNTPLSHTHSHTHTLRPQPKAMAVKQANMWGKYCKQTMHFVGLVSRCTGTRMQTRLRDQLELLVVPRQQQARQIRQSMCTPFFTPSSCVCGVPSSLLTALQGGIDVDSGFMNPRDHSYQFLDKRGHHTTQNGGAAARRG